MRQYFWRCEHRGHYTVWATSDSGCNVEIVDTASTKRGVVAIVDRLNAEALVRALGAPRVNLDGDVDDCGYAVEG
jgi:hypothetical protein